MITDKRLACSPPEPVLPLAEWAVAMPALGTDPLKYREQLNALKQTLFSCFDHGNNIDSLIKDYTKGIDQLLLNAWQAFGLDQLPELSLVATGGYGRRELLPYSDIDLLILLPNHCAEDCEEDISAFVTFLWDLGVDLGHSVRTIEQSIEEGLKDVTIATNLFEMRSLTPENQTYVDLEKALDAPDFWPAKPFFHAKLNELERRHERYSDSGYQLEPNVKDGPGALRDIQTLAWITKRHYKVDELRHLIGQGFILEDEYNALCQGRNFLWRVRFALHRIADRREDRLLFDLQKPLAAALGFEGDGNPIQAVEDLMQQYYRTVTHIGRISEMLLQHFDEQICLIDEPETIVELNQRFILRNNYLDVRGPDVFEQHPSSLLEVFLLLQQYPEAKGVRASTIRLIRTHLYLIDDNFRNDIISHSLFMDILRRPVGVYHEFKRMNSYGVLARYLPAFEHIVGRMQFDLFHIYTVDEHILMVLRYVRRLGDPRHLDEIPHASAIYKTLRKPELLYLAALFHDIGKGHGGDHSEIGAVIAAEFCRSHGLGDEDTETVSWLVEQHLLMSLIAQRKDISDPDIINDFAGKVSTMERLDYLYLLTISDIRGTNPELWNGWRASLLSELYRRTRQWLDSMDSPDHSQAELILDHRLIALRMLAEQEQDESTIVELWKNLTPEYFQRHSPHTIVWHTKMLQANSPENDIQVEIIPRSERETTKLAIFAKAHRRFFSLVTHIFAQAGLNIVDARIFTTLNAMALDTFNLLEADGSACVDPYRLNHLKERLIDVLTHPDRELPHLERLLPRRLRSFDVPLSITISNPLNRNYTELEITAQDRPGLLADIAQVLYQSDIEIQVARIATAGERAEDVLYISTLKHEQLSTAQIEELNAALTTNPAIK